MFTLSLGDVLQLVGREEIGVLIGGLQWGGGDDSDVGSFWDGKRYHMISIVAAGNLLLVLKIALRIFVNHQNTLPFTLTLPSSQPCNPGKQPLAPPETCRTHQQ